MNEPLHFKTRDEFRIWLINHCMSGGGIWLKFEKSKNTAFKAGDALEEALCFGWIDGVMKRIDDESYIKYFSARRKDSKWSEKNKALAEDLEKRGLMTDFLERKYRRPGRTVNGTSLPDRLLSQQNKSGPWPAF